MRSIWLFFSAVKGIVKHNKEMIWQVVFILTLSPFSNYDHNMISYAVTWSFLGKTKCNLEVKL